MASSIKLENHANKHHRLQQHHHGVPMSKNLHLSEVITTTAAPHMTHQNPMIAQRQSTIDPVEMTKLLSNITTTPHVLTKKTNDAPSMDYPSRLNQFSWEEIEGRYVPVIFRYKVTTIGCSFYIFFSFLFPPTTEMKMASTNATHRKCLSKIPFFKAIHGKNI